MGQFHLISSTMHIRVLSILCVLIAATAAASESVLRHEENMVREFPQMSALERRGFMDTIKALGKKILEKGKVFINQILPAIKKGAKECAVKLIGKRGVEEVEESTRRLEELVMDAREQDWDTYE